MRDAYFAYATAGIWIGSGLLYLAIGRGSRSDRVERFGGSVLMGKGVMNWAYWMLEPMVRGLARLDVTANMMTWASLALGIGAAGALAVGMPGLACLLATISTLGDILDGQIARYTHTGSQRGELLDSAVDRYTELAFVAGFIVNAHQSVAFLIVGLTALQACMMISYSTAKAEALGITPPRGLMRRHERAAYLISGVGISSMLGSPIPAVVAFSVVAVVGNLSAIRRLTAIAAELR